jgi:hypothetical protein
LFLSVLARPIGCCGAVGFSVLSRSTAEFRFIAPVGAKVSSRGWSKAKPPEEESPLCAPRRGAGQLLHQDYCLALLDLPRSSQFFLRPLRGGGRLGNRSGGTATLHPRLLTCAPLGRVFLATRYWFCTRSLHSHKTFDSPLSAPVFFVFSKTRLASHPQLR